MIEEIDWALRFLATGICWGAIPIILSGRINRKKASLALLGLVTPMVLFSFSAQVRSLSFDYELVNILQHMIRTAHPIVSMWAFLELLDPQFKPRPRHLIYVLITLVSFAVQYIWNVRGPPSLVVIFTYGYLMHRAYVLNKIDGDRVRSRFRTWFLTSLAIMFIVLTSLNLSYFDTPYRPLVLYFIQGPMIIVFALAITTWTLRTRSEVLELPRPGSERLLGAVSVSDQICIDKIQEAVDQGFWRTEGLTIAQFADELKLPEHRLRKTINKDLGFKNFSQFLNNCRIKEACRILADPQKAETPVSSIAYSLGYSSIGPFNRAFRSVMDMSPSTFRKHRLLESTDQPEIADY